MLQEGLGQCTAEMVAAQRFNQQEGNDIAIVYGAVTTGTLWTFLSLTGALLTLDPQEYLIAHPVRMTEEEIAAVDWCAEELRRLHGGRFLGSDVAREALALLYEQLQVQAKVSRKRKVPPEDA